MEKTLLDEFEKYEAIKNGEFEISNSENLSPTIATLLICNDGFKLNNLKTIINVEPDNAPIFENKLLNELEIPKTNKM